MASTTVQRAVIAGGIAALLSLLLFVRIDADVMWLRLLLNGSHGPIFACIAAVLASHRGGRAPADRVAPWPDMGSYIWAFSIALALGILVEALQGLSQRPPSLYDVGSDAAGAAIGLGLWAFAARARHPSPRLGFGVAAWTVVGLALAGLVYLAWYPVQAARAYLHRADHYPVVAVFSEPIDLYFVATRGAAMDLVNLPKPWAMRADERALRIRSNAGQAPTVQVVEPSPDWRGYSTIAADVTNPAREPLRLTMRIHDAFHSNEHNDRFNQQVVLPPSSRTTVRVALSSVESAPRDRTLDLSRVAGVMFFGKAGTDPTEFYLSAIWLE
jgi:hypothetical protein